ncbi:MAG: MarR family transcriptional regulator [Acidobacteriota bacterium]|nr:MarR family transcriptional regulator [Acidobacteriota bacterium]
MAQETAQAWWDELERLSAVLGRVGPDEVCCGGLTQRQCAILRILSRREGARLAELAAHCSISPSAMSRVLDKLEQRGLVRREWGAGSDRRAASVVITAAGRKTRRQLDRLMLERSAQVAAAMTEAQRARVLSALHTLNQTLENTTCCGLNEPVEILPADEEGEA